MLKHLLTISAVALAVANAGFAQPTTTAPAEPPGRIAADRADVTVVRPPPADGFFDAQTERQLRASDILGKIVASAEGEELGEIKDLILDENGHVDGLVVSVGGFLGIAGKQVAVAWSELRLNREGPAAGVAPALDRDREELEAAPAFQTLRDVRAEQEAETARQRMLVKQERAPVTPVQQALHAVAEAQRALEQGDSRAAQEVLGRARAALEQAMQAAGQQPAEQSQGQRPAAPAPDSPRG